MIEAGANEVDEETMLKAITRRSRGDQEDAGVHQRHRQAEIGKPKLSFDPRGA